MREHGAVRRVLGAHAAALSFGAAVTPIEVVYVKESLGAGDLAYGLLLAAWGAGTVLSSVALARFGRASALVLIPLSAAAVGAGYLVMAGAWSLPARARRSASSAAPATASTTCRSSRRCRSASPTTSRRA